MPQTNKNYTEDGVLNDLYSKHDVKVPRNMKKIFCLYGPRAKGDVGNKTKGKIEFLVKKCGYTQVWVDDFR